MVEIDRSARTMRIDIHPDFQGESLARKKVEAGASSRIDDTSFLIRHRTEVERSADYEKLLQSIYDGVLIADSKGRIIDFNARAVDFFFAGESELFGMRVVDLISGADAALLSSIKRNLLEHRYTLIEAFCVRRDGTTFPAEIAANKVNLDNESEFCFFIRDITVRKKAQEALEDAVRRLQEHDEARSRFVSNVSHELRTPLTSMIYAVDNMLRGVVGQISDQTRRYLELLYGDCKRLLGTVNDILDLRKVENKTLKLFKTKIAIARFVYNTMQSLRVQAEQKHLHLEMTTEDTTLFVECDPQKMERVLMNVVGNSIKFTPDGGRIEVRVVAAVDRKDRVLVSMEDSGIGIPKEALAHVTERYFTVGEQPSGTGLGLSISKEIVELHTGILEIKSPPPGRPKGTGVYISLPTIPAPTLLVVDDERAICELLRGQLQKQGYRVISTDNGVDALMLIARESPDLVLLDLVMPEMDGTQVILKMKSEKNMTRIPVIVISGAHPSRMATEVLQSFSIPALRKPWKESELFDSVEEAFLGGSAFGRFAPMRTDVPEKSEIG